MESSDLFFMSLSLVWKGLAAPSLLSSTLELGEDGALRDRKRVSGAAYRLRQLDHR